jgi:XTP/dITP diphosphohydrolase
MDIDLRRIVIATGNPHKVSELRAMLALPGVEFIGLAEMGTELTEPAETGATFDENATIKARAYAAQTGLPCLADDSGLEVDALGGAPGVISSHYSTGGREAGLSREERDAANNARLLRELEGVSPERRSARFVCVMVLSAAPPDRGNREGPAPILVTTRGTFEGRIGLPGEVPRGSNGFGYDPLFLVGPDFTHTSAELEPPEKNGLSHRGAAARAMLAELSRLLNAD